MTLTPRQASTFTITGLKPRQMAALVKARIPCLARGADHPGAWIGDQGSGQFTTSLVHAQRVLNALASAKGSLMHLNMGNIVDRPADCKVGR